MIDLDRSQLFSKSCIVVNKHYGRHEMYTPEEETWTLENLDWKQLVLMISKILDTGSEFQDDSGFIQKLIKKGTYMYVY